MWISGHRIDTDKHVSINLQHVVTIEPLEGGNVKLTMSGYITPYPLTVVLCGGTVQYRSFPGSPDQWVPRS